LSEPAHVVELSLARGSFRLELALAWDERVTVIFGPSGSGKSTLFEALLGLHPRSRARVRLGGTWLEQPPPGRRLPPEARRLGWVPQDPALFPHLSVERNLRFAKPAGPEADAALARAIEVLELRELLPRPVSQLSGGERQRIAIGRALASLPRALLLDEPLASLDLALRARVLRHLLRLRDELEIPILYITHDPDEALLVGERVVVLDAGRERASGPPAPVLWSRAVLPLSQALGLENVFEGSVTGCEPDACALLTAGGLRLVLPVPAAAGERICVGLRAQDVLLAAQAPGPVSARNVWEARVTHCQLEAPDAYVHLEVGPGRERLVAKLTASAAHKLGLQAGSRVHALVKAQAIHRVA